MSAPAKATTPAPDGGWGWMVVLGSFLIHVIADGVTYSYGVLAVEFIDHFDATREQIGWIGSIMVGVTLGVGPLSSALCARFGFRLVTMLGAVVSALGFGLSFFARATWLFFLTLGLTTGLGFGLMYLPAIVTVGIYFERKRSLAMGLAVCGSGVGTFVFAALIEYLLEEYTWHGAVLVLSALILNCLACGAVFRPLEPPPGADERPEAGEAEAVLLSPPEERCSHNDAAIDAYVRSLQDVMPGRDGVARSLLNTAPLHLSHPQLYLSSLSSLSEPTAPARPARQPRKSLRQRLRDFVDTRLLRNPIFVLFVISNFLTSIGFNAPYMYVPDRAVQEGIDTSRASFLVSVIGIANTVGRIVFGLIANHPNVNRLQLYNVSLTLCGLATVFSCFCKTYPSMVFYTFAFGLFTGVYVALTSVVLVDLLGVENLNKSFGITLLFQGLAVLIGPPLAGFIFDRTNNYDPSFWVCGSMIAMSGIILFPLTCIKQCLVRRGYVFE